MHMNIRKHTSRGAGAHHTTLPSQTAVGSLGLRESGLLSPASLAVVRVRRVHLTLDMCSVVSGEFQEWP